MQEILKIKRNLKKKIKQNILKFKLMIKEIQLGEIIILQIGNL